MLGKWWWWWWSTSLNGKKFALNKLLTVNGTLWWWLAFHSHLGSRSHKLRPKLCCNCTISLHEIWEVIFWHCFISFHFLLMGGLNLFLNLGRAKGRSILNRCDRPSWPPRGSPEFSYLLLRYLGSFQFPWLPNIIPSLFPPKFPLRLPTCSLTFGYLNNEFWSNSAIASRLLKEHPIHCLLSLLSFWPKEGIVHFLGDTAEAQGGEPTSPGCQLSGKCHSPGTRRQPLTNRHSYKKLW